MQDFQTQDRKHFLTSPQAKILLIDPKEGYFHIGRRGGKTSEIVPHLTLNRIQDMPRAGFLFIGRTYQQVLTRLLPSIQSGWEKRGFYENVHYVVGKKPPTNWPRTYYAPKDYKHFISTITGTGFHIGSQDREGLVNSLTVWGIFGDESKFLIEERFKEDAIPTNTAPPHYFPNHPHNRTIILTSSMPDVPSGNWLFDMEKRMDTKQIAQIFTASILLETYKAKLLKAHPFDVQKIQKIINVLQIELNKLRQNSVLYVEASTFANLKILGLDYYKQQQKVSNDKFIREICNVRPKHVATPFYANLRTRNADGKQSHFYVNFNYGRFYDNLTLSQLKDQKNIHSLGDDDVVKSQPLKIGMDFGHRINCIVTGQMLNSVNEFRILKNHYVKSPKILTDVCEDWCNYYRTHTNKTLYFRYDRKSGNQHFGNSHDTMAEMAEKVFRKHGWNVILETQGGNNPAHDLKYILWNMLLIENNPQFPIIRINEVNCEELKYGMLYTGTKEDRGKVKKDKSSEHIKSIPDEYATDLPDAADYLLWGEFSHLLHDNVPNFYDFIIR